MWKTILDVPVKVEVDTSWVKLVRITEANQRIVLTLEALADIAEAIARYLEEPFFTEEDLAAGRRAITELMEMHGIEREGL